MAGSYRRLGNSTCHVIPRCPGVYRNGTNCSSSRSYQQTAGGRQMRHSRAKRFTTQVYFSAGPCLTLRDATYTIPAPPAFPSPLFRLLWHNVISFSAPSSSASPGWGLGVWGEGWILGVSMLPL